MITSRCRFLPSAARLWRAGLLLLGLLPGLASAATLTGRLRDNNTNSFLFGASVVIRELGRSTITEPDGTYLFGNVPAGTYAVTATFAGYEDVVLSVVVTEGIDNRADFTLGREVVRMPQFVVEGNREGQARALQQKRTADSIVDVVSADSAGKLPDGNAAEAVRRLPGVFAEIDQNEGRYIVVRGIDASLNNVTLNGVNLGSAESGSRGAAMDSVPADLISRIEVIKAVTPDMDAQGIGASVNIVTTSAFDRGGTFANGTVAGGYFNGPRNEFKTRKQTPYSASALVGTTFGDGKWGIVLGGSYSFRHYISNRRSGGSEWYPAGAPGTPGENLYVPASAVMFHYDVQRWRQGLNAALEYKPDDRNYYAFRVSDNRFQDEEGREQNNFEFFRTAYAASSTDNTASFTGGRATVEYRYYLQKHNYTNYSFNGRNALGDGSSVLDYTLAVGNAEKHTPDRQDWEFRSAANLTSTVDVSGEYYRIFPSAAFFDAASYPFRRVRFRRDEETEDNRTAALNFQREQPLFGRNTTWQVGAKYFSRGKDWDRTNVDYNAGTGANLFNLSQFGVSKPAFPMFGGAEGFQMSPQIDLAATQQFFASNPNYFVANPAGTLSDSTVTDFGIDETATAGYAMAKIALDARWSLLAGVRLEHSQADVHQTEFPTVGGVVQAPRLKEFSKTFTHVLPGVHLRFAPLKNWIFRAAWTNTIGRPNYPDMAATSVASFTPDTVGGNVYTIAISEGNPDLKPYESSNLDLTSEYYFRNAGILAVSAFHKNIKNPVFTQAYTLRDGTYQGFNYSTLSYSKPLNADRGRITGVEFNYQQQLTMLPSPFDGLGFSVNYTLADSEEKLPSRPGEDVRFAKQPDRIYNAAIFYEKYGVQARLAYTYTGDFIKAFGGTVRSDQGQSERKIIDAKISYRLTKNFTIFADVINLGEEPLDEYAGYPRYNQATEAYWWTANFGVNWRL